MDEKILSHILDYTAWPGLQDNQASFNHWIDAFQIPANTLVTDVDELSVKLGQVLNTSVLSQFNYDMTGIAAPALGPKPWLEEHLTAQGKLDFL